MIKEQFEHSLENPFLFWSSKTKDEIYVLMGKEISAMVGYDQRNPHHCYDLFMHTLHTVAGIQKTSPILLRTAAFFHDIAKPVVAMEKQGRLVFYGHAHKSAKMIPPLLKEMGYSDDEIKEICFYIRHHDDFISWVLPEERNDPGNQYSVPVTEKKIKKHIDKVQKKIGSDDFQPNLQSWKNLLELCYADASAQADVVVQNEAVIDTKEHKLRKIRELQNLLEKRMSQISILGGNHAGK